MGKTKRFCFALLFLAFCFSNPLSGIEGRNIRVVFDGQPYKAIKLYNFSSYDYFSVKDIASYYDASLEWYPVSGKVALVKNNKRLEVFIKSTRVRFNNKKKRLNIPVETRNDDVFVPAEILLSDYFSDFSQSRSSLNRNADTLEIARKPTIILDKFYKSKNTVHLFFKLPDHSQFSWSDKKTAFELHFSKGVIKNDKIAVSNGIIEEMSSFNSEGVAIVEVSLSTGTDKMGMYSVRNRGRTEIVITSSFVVPKAATVDSSEEEVVVPSEDEELLPLSIQGAASAGLPGQKKLIILDAGHGGQDPGAVGPDGVKEKEIALSIVEKLKAMLDRDGSYETILTRSDDTFVPLVERTNLANEKKADLFISVHCNASPNRSMNGFEVYFLSENASDSEAQATAIFENSAVHFEKNPSAQQAKLQDVLWSMAVNEFINESSELSSLIDEEVSNTNKVDNRGVKQAGFFVLRGAAMPAVLVETAFISNEKEESKLKKAKFQKDIARLIYLGIGRYESRKNNISKKENQT